NTRDAVMGFFDAGVPSSFGLDDRRAAYLHSAFSDSSVGSPPDSVARVLDIATGTEREIGPADELTLVDGLVLLRVPETRLGRDLNGDQDEDDSVLQVHDPRSRRTFDTGVAIIPGLVSLAFGPFLALEGRALVIAVPEFVEQRDENHDGDLADSIVHVVRLP